MSITKLAIMTVFSACLVFALLSYSALQPVASLATVGSKSFKPQLLDRHGKPLTVTYQNRWNQYERIELHRIPRLLQQAFIVSEDKRFFTNYGADWLARLHAVWQNILAVDSVRGASTIAEQVVRMLHPRQRTVWARWLEGFEAAQLEQHNSKAEILEFYLNQVPYAAQRRGLVQAANYYFNRDLTTLNAREMLALVVMVRAPGRFNVHKDIAPVAKRIEKLADRLLAGGFITQQVREQIAGQSLHASNRIASIQARHFARYVLRQAPENVTHIDTTLDANLQDSAQRLLDQRLQFLQDKQVDNAGLLVVDHSNAEVLAWVVGNGAGANGKLRTESAVDFDAVRQPRQPGSTLKPFVYALALTKGWTAATLIDDSPLSVAVAHGMHSYRNYSRVHYGAISLREALGNSLNIPAVKAMQFVGSDELLNTFRALGVRNLDQHPDYYGDGLALGNGELSLFELVQAYSTLARRGVFTPLRTIRLPAEHYEPRRVFSEEVADLIGHILSDPEARRLEFGSSGLLDMPVQTAIKTGTSSDYRDAWAVAYNYRYVVGVWMGNLRSNAMQEVTGSTGPALVVRSVLAHMTRDQRVKPLPLSDQLVKQSICIDTGLPTGHGCQSRDELFISSSFSQFASKQSPTDIRIRQPYTGLQMARDPRIPDDAEAFEFKLNQQQGIAEVQWILNGELIAHSTEAYYLWPLQAGRHSLQAKVRRGQLSEWFSTPAVAFVVK